MPLPPRSTRGPVLRDAFRPLTFAVALGTIAFGPMALADGRAALERAPAAAQPSPTAVDAATIEALMDAGRVTAQTTRSMARLRESVRAGLASEVLAGRLERKRLPRIEGLVDEVYTGDALHDAIEEALGAELRPGDAASVLAHVRSPLGQRMLDSEDAHSGDDAQAAFARFAAAFETRPDADARLGRAAELERIIGFAEVQGGFVLDMQRAMLAGVSFSVPPEARAEIAGLLAELDAQRAALVEQLREPMTLFLAFLYEDLSLEEQDAMLAYAATPGARRFSAALVRGMSEGLQRTSIEFGDRLGGSLSIASIDEEI